MIMVTAVDQNGFVSDYSSPGASGLISAFGTPGEVYTTDRTGQPGYQTGDFNPGFNGTSSATPMVAGVVALMLEANPLLGWRDVQDILAYSARHVGTAVGAANPQDDEQSLWTFNSAKTWNGGGLHYSNDYGFGLVDAKAAVRLAEHWLAGRVAETSANDATVTLDLLDQGFEIPSARSLVFSKSFSGNFDIDSSLVTVTLGSDSDGFLPYMQDLAIAIYDPNGVQSIVHQFRGDTLFTGTWTFSTQAFRGQNASGNWTFELYNQGFDFGTILDVKITHRGGTSSIDDNVVFTNEYSDYADINTARKTISDTDGGKDTINASAVTSSSIINLTGAAASLIDGVSVTLTAGQFENAIGGDGADAILGNDLANLLVGGRGNDTMLGSAGQDTLRGGQGDDLYAVTTNTATVIELAGQGVDTVTASVSYTLAANVENLTLGGSAGVNGTGNALANRITGNAGANLLNGGAGADTMTGGLGNDRYVVDNAGDVVTEAANGGVDTVLSSRTYTLGANVENLTLTGTAVANGTGNALANALIGNSAANLLNGAAGADTMTGGLGDDRYVVENVGDRVVEAANGGKDTVISSITYTLAAQVENLTLGGAAAINGTGNTLANLIIGNAAANQLAGGGGADTLQGGLGDDRYIVSAGGVTIVEATNGGTDTAISSVNHTMALNVEKLIMAGTAAINGVGNALANTMTGNSGANLLSGGAGADTMQGGLGDDRYVVDSAGDRIVEAANGGTDTVIATVSHSLAANVENLTIGGAASASGIGNALANVLTGNSAVNVIDGGLGMDTLTGGSGKDSFLFRTALSAANVDTIADFSVVDDTIRLENSVFLGLADGALGANAFTKGTVNVASDAFDRIIYNSVSGALFFDRDGSGATYSAIRFAILDQNLALTAQDFLVV
jgi:Ca2+-binding RTX toxin-like protein